MRPRGVHAAAPGAACRDGCMHDACMHACMRCMRACSRRSMSFHLMGPIGAASTYLERIANSVKS
eukprot:365535-Chlamydomonas_euryale.AAC.26